MINLDLYEFLYLANAFLVQLILVIHFALRKWRFAQAMRFGRVVYAFGIPCAIVSIIILLGGKGFSFWLGGVIYLVWALFGYVIEYVLGVEWRNALRWPILVPYVVLYLATVMFYWWPVGLVYKPLWYGCAVLFIISTYLNATSHKSSSQPVPLSGGS
jgi:hypothetical protein